MHPSKLRKFHWLEERWFETSKSISRENMHFNLVLQYNMQNGVKR